MSAGIDLVWLNDGPRFPAHLCVINADGPKKRAASICGYVSKSNMWQPAHEEMARCQTCVNMDESGHEIVFVDPGSGRKVVVRERRR
jgi:hypothetical protein